MIECLTGLPHFTASTPSGILIGQIPHAIILERRAKSWLTRPNTPFCSWISIGILSIVAASIVGKAGYPPNPATTCGLSINILQKAEQLPDNKFNIPLNFLIKLFPKNVELDILTRSIFG